MKSKFRSSICLLALLLLAALGGCGEEAQQIDAHGDHHDNHQAQEPEVEKGSHNGRLLRDEDFSLELAIFETGVPPEYRAWAYQQGKPIAPSEVNLVVRLTRLGNQIDTIQFAPQGDALRGDSEIYEPHSFTVSIDATHQGKQYRWQYDSFEGRTRIEPAVAQALGINTELAGPATLKPTLDVVGKIGVDPSLQRDVQARFEGVVTEVQVVLGQTVSAGQSLFSVESNESLKSYTVKAPISGVITTLDAKAGQQTGGKTLARIIDNRRVLAELAIFPAQWQQVKVGAAVTVKVGEAAVVSRVESLTVAVDANQALTARVRIDQPLPLGAFVQAQVQIAEFDVPLAVKRSGLQSFRDFTVVYAQIGDDYEVRMLELGRQAGEWVEVLGGLAPGTRYVTDNSFVIKADIEKSGASHDH